jgi:hypothetical protein
MTMQIIQSIQNRIYLIRGERVMLDYDLAELYQVATKVLNQAVKRQIKRFPADFMFQLTESEWSAMRSQIVTSSQLKRKFGAFPYAFTEQGVAMLSGVLNSDRAISMNIAIMRAFIEIRKILIQEIDLKEQLIQIKDRLGEHDIQLNQIYDALENLLDEKVAQQKWEERKKIGFKTE